LLLVEPGTFDIEQPKPREAGECECIQRQLRDRLVGARVWLVIKNMNGAIADLDEVYMAGEDAARLQRVTGKYRAQP
jgi:hypothetical protein